ncbi:hypothetical protein CCAX7_000380 [Capsulimonas corticalis]|uniref:Uncharacterized protein n=1 Tax=Capsulimonas corticalis TaxID=2219043 RepID=A0A402CRG4_9BACT|nr:hypothetical protein [Capsulimonas corticalis]BDI27987.1 hypothetical protein CCAX7_000380 [Capsulimonas corticalis]
MPTELHVFGSGKCRIGNVGATLTDSANGVGSVQDSSMNTKYDKKELYNTPIVSMFPVDVGFSKGECSVKINFKDINRDVIARITGATKTTVSTTDTYTIGKTAQPTKFRLELDQIDTNGKNVKIVLFNCYAVDLPLTFKLDDFADMQIEVFCLGDPANAGAVGTISLDQ